MHKIDGRKTSNVSVVALVIGLITIILSARKGVKSLRKRNSFGITTTGLSRAEPVTWNGNPTSQEDVKTTLTTHSVCGLCGGTTLKATENVYTHE